MATERELQVARDWKKFYAAIKAKYLLDADQYRSLYLAQSGRCYICRVAKGMHPDDPKGHGGRRLGVDHNHLYEGQLRAVRGLLCTGSTSANTCNRLIGRYSHAQLNRAVRYLERPPAWDILGSGPMGQQLPPSETLLLPTALWAS